ncbi:MAG: GDP-mannose 4,6-dehydratase [Planctomycetota bacterium]
MHYLVTGGAGFIGGHLCRRLVEDGHRVTILDNLSTGRFTNVKELEKRPEVKILVESVQNEAIVREAVRGVDKVFHLASSVGVQLIMDEPIQAIENMINGTQTVLKAAAVYRKPILLTSSSEVYGKSEAVPFREDGDREYGPTSNHRWAYANAKAIDEFLCLAHHKKHGLPVYVVRLFNTVGPGQTGQYGMVIPRFVTMALAGDAIPVYGDGSQTRCFCHVQDVIEALEKLVNCEAAVGEVVNVGSTEEVTMLELAKRVKARAKSKSAVKKIPYAQAFGAGFEDMQRRVPAIEKVKKLIGWAPKSDLNKILDDIIAERRKK